MGEEDNRGAVERYWEALGREDFEAAVAELHEDFVETYPQSGERTRGKENWLGLLSSNPAFPAIRVRRHLGRGDVWVTEAAFDYARDGSPPWQICEVQECNEGKIVRIDAYFGAPFEAAEWRSRWVERS
jgi:limonene-1,2-epoxide hydrolase